VSVSVTREANNFLSLFLSEYTEAYSCFCIEFVSVFHEICEGLDAAERSDLLCRSLKLYAKAQSFHKNKTFAVGNENIFMP